MPRLNNYQITANINIVCTCVLKAENIEEALAYAKDLTYERFIKVKGEVIEDAIDIEGIYQD